MTLYRNQYRVESARHPTWDYSNPGAYFITICTRDRRHFFGRVIQGKMHLSPIGQIIAEEWQRVGELRPNIRLDEWIIMPNHFHAIIIILPQPPVQTCQGRVSNPTDRPQNSPSPLARSPGETGRRRVSTERRMERQRSDAWKPGVLGAIVGQFKSACTKRIWAAGFKYFGWHARFHDHIIRDEYALRRIRCYIRNNPTNWTRDRHRT
ncbi:MAG: hypothetical protein B0A82_17815 [Alkalinema sp. CACIAM 70d]|nr:MAG: hypothetical protein B0A82_17815 [Alkalinema sp. CACIAM 70d]